MLIMRSIERIKNKFPKGFFYDDIPTLTNNMKRRKKINMDCEEGKSNMKSNGLGDYDDADVFPGR